MKNFKRIANWIRDSKGVATSLIEATATIAVGATLAAVAVGAAADAINDAKVQAAINDVQVIGQGIFQFYRDDNFYPMFSTGNQTGPTANFFGFLVSESGNFPIDGSADHGWTVTNDSGTWDSTPPVGSTTIATGNKPGFTAAQDGNGSDSIEGQLIRNILGNTSASYPLFSAAATTGWKGPYVTSLPRTDPWNNKYIVNIRGASNVYLASITGSRPDCVTGGTQASLAVFVISAGPNGQLDTPVNQCKGTNTQVLGDDIVARIF